LPFVLLQGVLWEQRQVRKEEGGKKTCEALSLALPPPEVLTRSSPRHPSLLSSLSSFSNSGGNATVSLLPRSCVFLRTRQCSISRFLLVLPSLPPFLPPRLPLPCFLTSRRSPPPRPSPSPPSQASPSLRLPSSRRPSCPTAKLSHCAQARGGGREGGRQGGREGGERRSR
jgi:hypothetical protein